MRGVVVIEFWKKLCRNWCFVIYSGGRQPKLGLKLIEILWHREPRLEMLFTCSSISIPDVPFMTWMCPGMAGVFH